MRFPNKIEYSPRKHETIHEKLDKSMQKNILYNSEKFTEAKIEKIVQKAKSMEEKMKRAVKFGIIGLGQAGGRIGSEFAKLGYPTLFINTSEQDLAEVVSENKLLIGQGGAGKDPKVGKELVNKNRDKIMAEYHKIFNDVEHILVVGGSSGGTGGSMVNIIDTVVDFKKPVGCLTTFPLATEDTTSKKNTLNALNDIIKYSQKHEVSPIIILDNDKIEKKYPNLSILEFWHKANEEVVKAFDLFNMLAFRSSPYTSFDTADYKKVLHAGGCMIFGNISVPVTDINKIDLGKEIIENINSGLLAEGFNLVEATTAGCIIIGNNELLKKIPRNKEEDAFATLFKLLGSGTIFKGIYGLEQTQNIEIFFMISGLGTPVLRVKELIEEAKKENVHLQKKTSLQTIDDIMESLNEE